MLTFGKSNGGGRRKSPRSQAPLLATLSTIAHDYRAGLVNLSSTGARLSAPCLPGVGEDVILKADKVMSSGHVVWSEEGQCGVAFHCPITKKMLSASVVKQTFGAPPDGRGKKLQQQMNDGPQWVENGV
jgi:hypothetical protein